MYEDITVQRQTQAERERLAAILEATTDLVAVTNPQGQVIYLNRAGRKMVGFPDDLDITTTTIPDYHPRWAFERVLNEGLPAAMQTGIWSGETALLHRSDEAEIPVSQVIIVHRRADGEVEYLSTVMRDISDRKRLEQEIQESLARRARQVETSAEVAQEISAAPILAELFRRVVNLVKERFGYYHAHIYTLEQDTLVMQEGAGDAGRHMKAAGHQIPYDAERSLVARAARSGTPVLVADVTQEPDWLPNPLLPHTKSELAVPVKLRDELLGVLDVQSDRVAGLSDEDEIVLIGLCGQIASAIESTRRLQAANMFRQFAEESGQGFGWATLDGQVVYMNPTLAHLLGQPDSKQLIGQSMIPFYPPQIRQHLQADILPAVQTSGHWSGELFLLSAKGNIIPILETFFLIRDEQNAPRYLATVITDITEQKRAEVELQERLHELDTLYRTMSQEGWRTFLETTDLSAGYFFDQTTLRPLDEANIPEAKLALTQKRLISAPDGATVMPLLAHDLPLGVLGVYEDPQQPLAPEELALLEAVSEQVALALESARFFQQTRQASFLLDERIKELNCLNDIGREMDDAPSLPDFLQWVTERIPAAMRHPEICSAAIEYDGQLYGQAGAIQLPCQITNALRVGGEVVGRLYIAYSEKHDFLNEESALIGGISRRVSGYIENRRLLAETQEALAQTERAQRRYTVQAWETYRAKRGLLQYEQTHPTLLASPPELASSTSIIAAGDATLVVPLTVHDRVIGALGLQERVDGRPWLPEEVALVEAVAEQMAQAAEGLRLLDETQQQAAREQLARQITDKVRASQNIEAALKTAAQELAAALGTARAVIDLQLAPEDGAQNE
jgi:PAS domain S-box-containing protein